MISPALLAVLVLAWAPYAQARRESGPSSGGVFVNPVGLFYGPLSVEFAFGVGPQASLNLIGARWLDVAVDGPGRAGAWSVGAGVQMFPVGPLYEGIFVLPSVSMLWVTVDETAMPDVVAPATGAEDSTTMVTAYTPQLLFGYQWDWKVVSLRLGIGGVYLVQPAKPPAPGLDGLGLALDVSFGVTF
jgi:hypothetical protein